jgi:hypothetical protein
MNNNNNLIIQNNNIRIKQKNTAILQHLIMFKKYRRKCKDCLNEINVILGKNHIINLSNNINESDYISDINSLIIYSNKLKLCLLHMVYYFNKISIYS